MSAADPEKRSVVGKISQASASKPAKVVRSRGSPRVSVRFTEDEMVHLKRKAGNRSLATYIREATLGDEATSRPARYERKQRVPDWDHKTLAQMLGMLGKSELVRSMIALALAARARVACRAGHGGKDRDGLRGYPGDAQCAQKARITSGGRNHPDSCRFDLVAGRRFIRVTGWIEAL